MDNMFIVNIIIYIVLPILGALTNELIKKYRNKKYVVTALKIVSEVDELIDDNTKSAAGIKLRLAVSKLLIEHTCLTEQQATEIINRAVYEMNKALK